MENLAALDHQCTSTKFRKKPSPCFIRSFKGGLKGKEFLLQEGR